MLWGGIGADAVVQPSVEDAEGVDTSSSIEVEAVRTEADARDVAPLSVDPLVLTVAYDAPHQVRALQRNPPSIRRAVRAITNTCSAPSG